MLVALLAAGAASALATPARSQSPDAPDEREIRSSSADAVRWIAPRPGAALAAGEPVRVAWEPGARFDALGEVEEWELFLSLDGGRSWTVRLTPHLDAELRSVEVVLPPLPSADARLLLRLGNERIETAIELAGRFEIELSNGGDLRARETEPARALAEPSASTRPRGERALPVASGVVLWSEGDRRAVHRRWVAAAASDASLGSTSLATAGGERPLAPRRRAPTVSVRLAAERAEIQSPRIERPSFATTSAHPPIAPLLQTARRNE